MGYGDEIMAAGIAEGLYRRRPLPVAIRDRFGRARWSEVWAHNPVIATPDDVARRRPVQLLTNGVGCRPYIRYPFTKRTGIRFTPWRAAEHVGHLYLTDAERAVGAQLAAEVGPYVVIEPDIKSLTTPNKAWGLDRFLRVTDALPGVRFVRVSFDEPRTFAGAQQVMVRSFREACAVIDASLGYLGTEGGYHHAAGVLRKPAVVIFGGFISPRTTGYPWHTNLADEERGSPCGKWTPCGHCAHAMARISVESVVEAVRTMITTAVQPQTVTLRASRIDSPEHAAALAKRLAAGT